RQVFVGRVGPTQRRSGVVDHEELGGRVVVGDRAHALPVGYRRAGRVRQVDGERLGRLGRGVVEDRHADRRRRDARGERDGAGGGRVVVAGGGTAGVGGAVVHRQRERTRGRERQREECLVLRPEAQDLARTQGRDIQVPVGPESQAVGVVQAPAAG